MKIHKLLPILSVILFLGCTTKNDTPQSEAIVLIDRTDPLSGYPTEEEICRMLNVTNDCYGEIKLTLGWISDKDVDMEEMIHLSPDSKLTSNAAIRAGAIKKFRNEIAEALVRFRPNDTMQCPKSIILRSVVNSLNRLSESKAENRFCAVFSNLKENSFISFYDPRTLSMPLDTLRAIVRSEVALNNLNGITVWFIHQPDSYEANSIYMKIAEGLYKPWLESLHAKVEIKARLH